MALSSSLSRLLGAAFALGLLAAACSTPGVSAPATAPASAAAPGAAPVELAINGQDFSYVLPASVPAGPTTITLTNTGTEQHQAQLARINDGKTMADVLAALQQPDPAAAFALFAFSGGPTGVAPGARVSTIQELKAGAYVILCFVQSPDGVPHFAKGMVAPLLVTEPATAGQVPAGDAAVTARDFGYEGLTTLTAGRHAVTVTNQGPQPHEVTVVKLNDGVTVDALRTQFASGGAGSGPPLYQGVAGIAALSTGTSAIMNLDLQAGKYALICFVPDPASGKAHAELGMIGALDIT